VILEEGQTGERQVPSSLLDKHDMSTLGRAQSTEYAL
jgi:hypothetical protein